MRHRQLRWIFPAFETQHLPYSFEIVGGELIRLVTDNGERHPYRCSRGSVSIPAGLDGDLEHYSLK